MSTPEALIQEAWTNTAAVNNLLSADLFFTGEPDDEDQEPPFAVLEPITLEGFIDATLDLNAEKGEVIIEFHVGETWAVGRDLAAAVHSMLHRKKFQNTAVRIYSCQHRQTGKNKIDGKWVWRSTYEIKVQKSS